ncbi:MAG: YceH family protein [Terriglobia bacterium]|jgi:uncharacterized protein YceH (UPF0502 family)
MTKLDEVEVRVLGALLEKERTTPEYYPLSLNALINACNQKSNRDPVMALDESAVRSALESLNEKNLAGQASSADSRVSKYIHHLQEVFNFDRRESAVLCVLLLRGPQTPGELRGRTERMYQFDDLSVVESALHRLMEREPPLVMKLARQPGTKESRYAHLLSGELEEWSALAEPQPVASTAGQDDDRITHLEVEVQSLRKEVAELRQQLDDFRKQFE